MMTKCKDVAKIMRENKVTDKNGNIICSPEGWEAIASYIESKFKLFTVQWLDKFEKDSNGNALPRKADIIAYTQSDAESVIYEYYHYMPDSIKVSTGIEIENKMLLKEYN